MSQPQKAEPNKLQSILTFILIFLVVNFIFGMIFPKPTADPNSSNIDKVSQEIVLQPSEIDEQVLHALDNEKAQTKIVLDSNFVEFVFSTEGARLTSVKLRDYTQDNEPAELIPQGHNLSSYFYQLNFFDKSTPEIDTAIYEYEQTSPQEVVFSYLTKGFYKNDQGEIVKSSLPAGLLFQKRFTLSGNYQYELDILVSNKSSKSVFLNQLSKSSGKDVVEGSFELILGPELNKTEESYTWEHGYILDEKVKKLGSGSRYEDGFLTKIKTMIMPQTNKEKLILEKGSKESYYIASKYFLNILTPKVVSSTQAPIIASSYHTSDEDNTISIIAKSALLNSGDELKLEFSGYFGPKEYNGLKNISPVLVQAMGITPFFGIPISHWTFKLLTFLYGFLGNYGLAIIVLTLLIKILFLPLTNKSFSSMQNMQKLKPEMDKLKEKFKDNPQKINEETMKLYKKFKVNPLGGCLPMLVQLPIFFALFSVLRNVIELRGQAFISLPFHLFGHQMWITDLSDKDPTYILPIIMGVSMFYQQRMTMPAGGSDDPQTKMMAWMPVMFTFMFLNFPSGLVLYWLVNNLLTMGQQYYINKKI